MNIKHRFQDVGTLAYPKLGPAIKLEITSPIRIELHSVRPNLDPLSKLLYAACKP